MREETYTVTGMSCAACSAAVERVTRKLDGMERADVNLTTGKLLVCYDETKVTPEMIYDFLMYTGTVRGNMWSAKARKLSALKAFFKLAATGRHYDVFHIHTCSYGGFLSAVMGVTMGKLLHKRIVLTYHGGGGLAFFEKHHRFVRFFLTKTDQNIVLSGFLASIFGKFGIPYTIIPNIIEFDNSKFKERKVLSPNFISIRSLEPLYNIPCILKAFQIVKKSVPEAKLLIVGGGSQRDCLEQYVLQNNIADITFTGNIPVSKSTLRITSG